MSTTALAGLRDLGRRRAGDRSPRIVVIGNVGNGNTGDEALLSVTLDALGPHPRITVLSRDPAGVTALHGVAATAMRPGAAVGSIARCDALVVVGGGMFGPGLPPLVRLLPHVMEAAARAGKDTAYVGIGAYAAMPASTAWGLRRSVAVSRHVSVRDRASGVVLDPTRPPVCVGDLAMHLRPAPPDDARSALRAAGVDLDRPLLLIAPKAGRTPALTGTFVEASAHAARHWAAAGGSVAAMAFADRIDHGIPDGCTDAALCARIARTADTEIPLLGPNLHPALAQAIVAQSDAVLALRFHGVVFAQASGVPTISFTWEPKTAALFHDSATRALDDPFQAQQLEDWLDGCRAGWAGRPDPSPGPVVPTQTSGSSHRSVRACTAVR